jgi:hypothetical protein
MMKKPSLRLKNTMMIWPLELTFQTPTISEWWLLTLILFLVILSPF